MTMPELLTAVLSLKDADDIQRVQDALAVVRRGMVRSYRPGQTVRFDHPHTRREIQGTIKTVNDKTVTVDDCRYTDDGSTASRWRVDPSFLKA
jgi:hypothetical protein